MKGKELKVPVFIPSLNNNPTSFD